MIEFLFWILIFIIIYIYLGYPLLLLVLSRRKRWSRHKREYSPAITLIIAAHNEEEVIKEKIENVLAQDYPKNRMQVIVASDASTDRTNEISRNYLDKGVELYDQKEHKGKSAALNHIVANMASGEIIILNDVTTMLEKDAIKNIIPYFLNNKIGAVAGRLSFKSSNNSAITENHGLYWEYEDFLRTKESDAGYLPFVSGAFYSIRKNLYTPVPEHMPDDSVSPLGAYKQGYSVVYAEDALAHETGANDAGSEFRIKTRGIVRELNSIFYFKELLSPFKNPVLSLVLISHRLLRWSVPIFLIVLFLATLHLIGNPLYMTFFWIQIFFYLLAVCGFLIKKNIRIISLPFYFSLVNTAALWGIIKFLSGTKQSTWKSVR